MCNLRCSQTAKAHRHAVTLDAALSFVFYSAASRRTEKIVIYRSTAISNYAVHESMHASMLAYETYLRQKNTYYLPRYTATQPSLEELYLRFLPCSHCSLLPRCMRQKLSCFGDLCYSVHDSKTVDRKSENVKTVRHPLTETSPKMIETLSQ